MKKFLIALLALAMLGVCAAGCLAEGGSGAAVTSEEDIAAIYHFRLDGVEYALPCPVQQLLDNGWSFSLEDPDGSHLAAMSYASTTMTNAGGKTLWVDVLNATDGEIALRDAQLMRAEVRANDNPPEFETAAGIALGDPMSEIKAAYGEPYSESGSSDGSMAYVYRFHMMMSDDSLAGIGSIGSYGKQSGSDDTLHFDSDASGAEGVVAAISMTYTNF